MANETTTSTLLEAMGLGGGTRSIKPVRYTGIDLVPALSWSEGVTVGSGDTFDFIRYVAVTVPSGVKVEATGVAPNETIETLQAQATAGVVGLVIDQSYESIQDARAGSASGAAAEAARAIRKRALTDMLATATDLTASIGDAADACDLAHLGAAMASFESNCNPDGSPVGIVLHPGCWNTLTADLRVAAANSILQMGTALPQHFVGSGARGTLFGAGVFVTDSVAASTTGRSNIITPLGQGKSVLGLAIWVPVSAVELGPTDRYTSRTLMVARYGAVCTDPSAGVEFIAND